MGDLTIGEVASEAGIKASAIRYYEQINLLPTPPRRSGRRQYDPTILDRLRIIETAKALDFTLDEIKLFFEGVSENSPPSDIWRAFAKAKLTVIEERIAHAEFLRSILKMGLTCECLRLSDCMPASSDTACQNNGQAANGQLS